MIVNGVQVYRLGEKHPELAVKQNAAGIDIIDKRLVITVCVYKPTTSMLKAAKISENGLKLGIFCYRDVIAMAIKPGDLPWNDTFINPHLLPQEDLPARILAEGYEMGAQYNFVDSSCGLLHEMHVFGLGNKFSNVLINNLNTLKERPFDKNEYDKQVNDIRTRYTAEMMGTKLKQHYFNYRGRKR